MDTASILPPSASHVHHDEKWLVSSHHRGQPSRLCIACLTDMLEDKAMVTVKKKMALSELVALFNHDHVAKLLVGNEDVHLHLTLILAGVFSIEKPNLVFGCDVPQ